MVKRYPHTAIVLIEMQGEIVDGEYVRGEKSETEIKGRFDSINSDSVLKRNAEGIEVLVRGAFYTKHKPIAGAHTLKIESYGIKRKIVCWEQYQVHTIIYV